MTLIASDKMNAFLSELDLPTNAYQREVQDRLRELDFPTTRNEYWKYTRLSKISKASFQNQTSQKNSLSIEDHLISDQYIIIENGVVRTDLSHYDTNVEIAINDASSPSSIQVNPNDIFTTLNRAAALNNLKIKVAANSQIKTPLQLIYIQHGEQVITNNQLDIEIGKSAEMNLIISSIGLSGKGCFNNTVTTADVGENAHLTIHKIQLEGNENFAITTLEIRQAKNSNFKINTVTLNGLLVRNNINIAVEGENCETHMNGAIIGGEKQHVDNHTFVDHKVPNCFSNENYKYVLDDRSTGVFNGKVIVRQDAQVINAYQNNGNILLSDGASINSKPELEIYADDVKCSHGSTTGQLDENAIYYLQTRGISKANAKKMLVAAFIEEVIEAIEHESTQNYIHKLLKEHHNWEFI